jgi:CRP-like cAMP-binding protein
MDSHLAGFSSGASLGGKISRYRGKQSIYTQGAPAPTLFYIQEGGVRLSTPAKHQPSAVTAILGAYDFLASFAPQAIPFVRPRPSR